ncbi:hypothetical protein, partial [Actinoplanes sp. NPDC051851]|uniref:hypothetical protein n=1 Tax=Actinoplanes sp. NPDC051851 TaxID=3154753 RepID=UPI0034275EBF
GSREPGAGSREPGAGSREPGAGSREPGAGSRWSTVDVQRDVLVVARTVAALTRLLDVVSLIAGDPRIQISFTTDDEHPAHFRAGVDELLHGLEPRIVSWSQARHDRFDLALSASENDRLDQLAAPVLRLPHGLAFQKRYPGSTVISGLNPDRFPGAETITVGLAHPAQQQHPDAAGRRTAVVGDPAWGRMLASRHRRGVYRTALGATGRHLVVLASTWGPDSLLGAALDLPERLAARLPLDAFALVVVLHPGAWARHGPWQVRSWLARATAAGVRVLPPESGWQAALLAADAVVTDHGSLAGYAALTGVPLLLGPRPSGTTVPDSVADRLAAHRDRLDLTGDLRAQLEKVMRDHAPDAYREVLAGTVERPTETASRLRSWIHRAIALPEPSTPAEFPPLPVPPPAQHTATGAWVAGIDEDGITRYPDTGHGPVHEDLPYRHVVARLEHATLTQVAAAAILGVDRIPDEDPLASWPHATLLATVTDGVCHVRTRQGAHLRLRGGAAVDPWALASWVWWRLQRGEPLTGSDQVRIGSRVITIHSEDC